MNVILQGQHATGLGRIALSEKRATIKMQAAANFSQSSSLLPRVPTDDNNAPAFCNWPRSCPWPKEQEIQVPRSGGLSEFFSGEDTMLPPDVEQMALFSDAFSDSNGAPEEFNWWTRLWRYQGL